VGEVAAVKRDFFNERLATGKDELGNPWDEIGHDQDRAKVGEAAF